jgi:hypothetical protein
MDLAKAGVAIMIMNPIIDPTSNGFLFLNMPHPPFPLCTALVNAFHVPT